MFRKIAAFELRYQLTSPVFWVAFGIFFLLTFGATTNSQIQIGSAGNVFVNSPYSIIQKLAIMSVFAIFILTAFVANVVVRDDETGYGPIIRATPVGKFDYLFGRFTGAFAAGMIAFASVPLGILIGSWMPWLDPEKLGPFRVEYYLYAYFLVAMPTLLVMGAMFFAIATATRSMLLTYVGVVGFLVAYLVLIGLFNQPQYDHLIGLIEPFGLGAVGEVTKYWTTFDRNTMLPPLNGVIAENRLIWFGASFAMLALAYFIFRFETKGAKRERAAGPDTAPAPRKTGPLPAPRFDSYATRVQSWKWARFEMAQVFKSPAFFVLLAIGLFNAGGSMWYADQFHDHTIYPVTRVMINALRGAFTIIPVIIALYYAGELVWRERDRRTHEIFDACPVPDWAFMAPKMVAIALVLLATSAISVLAAVGIQTLKGYYNYELTHYLLWYVIPETLAAVELAVLSVFVQTISPNKYVGWGLMGLYLVATMTFTLVGFEDRLYLYGATPDVPLTDMNGIGKFWIGAAWFDFYWCAFALALTVLTYALWRRGTETRLMPRIARLPHRLKGSAGVIMAVALCAFAGSGAYNFYNTHVLNEYRTSIGDDKFSADFEKALLPFEKLPQPRITDVTLNVAVYPHDARIETEGSYAIVNRTAHPIPDLHIRLDRDLKAVALNIDGATLKKDYGRFNYRIYAFDKPMQPGEKRVVRFRTLLEQKGFRNSGNTTRIVDNGTFVNNTEIAPTIGMDRSASLTDPVKRRRYGLPSQLRPPKLEDDSARANNYLTHAADWVMSDITVSTVADQTPIAPGYKVAESTANGRRTVRFKSDAPIIPYFSIQSADYAVKRDKWKNVDLAVYHDPRHPYNVDLMIAAMKASLEVYSRVFSPYQFQQVRILEFPAYATFAQSFANTIPYAEGIGFIQNSNAIKNDPEKIDLVTYVTAHEIGHQWWAHQVIGADMQGMTLLSETFAQYSAILVMEKLYGPEHVRKFLKYSLDRYLRARGSEVVEELPLERVENQGYIHYDKGAVVMYRLKEAVGEEVVNRALRRLIAEYAFKPAPYPASKDFVKILRQEAEPKYDQLITDLFQRITVYDLKAADVRSHKRKDGKFDVTLSVEAHKYYADGKGKETETPLHEDVDVGAFLVEPGKKGFDKSKILVFERLPLKSGTQVLHLVTDRAPAFAGIDPYNEWIDRNSDDNVKSVPAPGS
ncbi:MAG TPA: M1 family aminopeptidase [Rhizomicrobium sp.]